jgi:hypothetical protein
MKHTFFLVNSVSSPTFCAKLPDISLTLSAVAKNATFALLQRIFSLQKSTYIPIVSDIYFPIDNTSCSK